MIRKYLLPVLALFGALFALIIVYWTTRTSAVAPILFPPPVSPFPAAISGAGIIEASSRNISVGNPFSQIITELFVREGDRVCKDQPLFQIDTRPLVAQADSAKALIELARVTVENKKAQYSFYERLKCIGAVSEQAYSNAKFSMREAEENLNVAVENLRGIEVNIALSTIRAPLDAYVLQVNARPGMIAIADIPPVTPTHSINQFQGPNVLLGCVDPLMLRIDIDEDDAWRYKCGAKAHAFVRGNSHINFPLHFEGVEPYILPKVSFTGDVRERVDTRVLQVLYSFEWGDLPIYPGQILDVYIEAEPLR